MDNFKMKQIRFHGFVEFQNKWIPFDNTIPSFNEEPFENIHEAFKQLNINHYLIAYEELKNEI